MEDNIVDLVTMKIDLNNIEKVEVEFNDMLFDAMGITLEQVSSKLDEKILNDFVMNVYEAMRDSLNEEMGELK